MELLPEAARAEAVRKAAPEIADRLPLRFDQHLANPCVRHANGTLHGCLPAFFIAGAMQSGSADLWKRLQLHPHVPSRHDALSHWWTNHPRSRAGDFDRYVERFSNAATLRALRAAPESALLGEASPASLTCVMPESLRPHCLDLDALITSGC